MASKAESADARVVRWRSGTVVSVSRLPAPGQVMGRALGIGELLDPLDVGRAVRIRLDEGRALAPTEVTRIESVSRDVIRLDTRNHRYELRRIEASPSTIGVMSIHDAGAPRPNESVGLDATQIVRVEAWGETRPGRFECGARVRVTRTRDGETRVYPPATLLVDLAPVKAAIRRQAELLPAASRGQHGRTMLALKALGFQPMYDPEIARPLPWLSRYTLRQEQNFFETHVTEYRTAASLWDDDGR